MNNRNLSKLTRILGPGLMFAAVCIGVSHIVQATRAGAEFGLSILPITMLVVFLKYPAFRFAPQYTLGTGTSLLQGYRNIGRWAVLIYASISFTIMCIVLAAVSLVTSGLVKGYFNIDQPLWVISLTLMSICVAVIMLGHYNFLERIVKVLIILFSVITVFATIAIIGKVDWQASFSIVPLKLDTAAIAFIIAFVGWTPSGVGSSVWQSMWTLQKAESGKSAAEDFKYYMLDFNIGYVATALSIICFVILGTALMFQNSAVFSSQSSTFILQVIDLYETALGAWCRPFIALGSFAVLFSTLIGSIDGFPRTNARVYRSLFEDEAPWSPKTVYSGTGYYLFMIFGCFGGLLIQGLWLGSFTALIDFAVTLSFLTAPIVASFNHIAINSKVVAEHARPTRFQNTISMLGIVLIGLSSIGYMIFIFPTVYS